MNRFLTSSVVAVSILASATASQPPKGIRPAAGSPAASPVITVSPDSLSDSLLLETSTTQILTIENTGTSDLVFSIVLAAVGGPGRVASVPFQPLRFVEDFEDGDFDGWLDVGSGSKEVTSATSANGTMFSYHEFNAPVGGGNGVRQLFGSLTRPRYVSYFVRPGSDSQRDGYLVLNDGNTRAVIGCAAHSNGKFRVNDVFVAPYASQQWYHIEFRDINFHAQTFDFYLDGTLIAENLTFQRPFVEYVQYDDISTIDLFVLESGGESWWDEIVVTTGDAVEDWLFLTVANDTIPPDSIVQIPVIFDAMALVGGDYQAALEIASNDPVSPLVAVPVALHVTGIPDIAASPHFLDFGSICVGNAATLPFYILNAGTDQLSVIDVISTSPEFAFSAPNSFDLAPGDSQLVAVTFTPTADGFVAYSLNFTSNDPDESIFVVPLLGTGAAAPDITVTPSALSDTLPRDSTSTQFLAIENTGCVELLVGGGGTIAPWLTVTAVSDSVIPADSTIQLDVTFDATGLMAGDYQTAIGLTTNDPDEPFVYALVDLRVTGLGDIETDVDSLDFGGVVVGSSSVLQLRISNAGTENLIVDDVSSNHPDFSVTPPTSFTVPPNDSMLVPVSFAPSNSGPASGQITIASNDPDEPLVSVAISGTGLPLPVIVVSPDSLVDTLFTGEVSVHALTIANAGASDLIFAIDAVEPNGSASWISLSSVAGVVEPDSSTVVDVTLDAAGLFGAWYLADLIISTNVPPTFEHIVPLRLLVVEAPTITVSDTLLDFGTVFIGYFQSLTLLVVNSGTDTLTVTNVSSNQPEYSATPSSFAVSAGEFQQVDVTFLPTGLGLVSGALALESDDPVHPTSLVGLIGVGVDAPVISVSPDSLGRTLPPDSAIVDTVTITNTGGADLDWSIEVLGPGALSSILATSRTSGNTTPGSVRSDANDRGIAPVVPQFRIVWHSNHGLTGVSDWTTVITDLKGRGWTLQRNELPLTVGLLGDYDVLWLGDAFSDLTSADISAINVWVSAGEGGLLIESTQDTPGSSYSTLLQTLGTGIVYSLPAPVPGATSIILPHETTVGVNSVELHAPQSSLGFTQSPETILIRSVAEFLPVAAYGEAGTGRVIVSADQLFHNAVVNSGDNLLFAKQVFDWLADLAGRDWIRVVTGAGTIQSGNSAQVEVELNHVHLDPGTYDRTIEISTNDPATPTITIPVELVIEDVATGVAEGSPKLTYALRQNHPNPFNPSTVIQYEVPKATNVRVVIYTVRGERVKELVNGLRTPGRFDVEWDGFDSKGRPVASGVYFYQLQAGSFVQTKKMVLLR